MMHNILNIWLFLSHYQMSFIGLNLDIYLGIFVPTPAFACIGSACDGKILFEDATSLDPGNYESDFKLEVTITCYKCSYVIEMIS